MIPLNSLADWQSLFAHRLYQVENSLSLMSDKTPGRIDAVEMVEDFMGDADVQIRQLCIRANRMRKQIDKMAKERATNDCVHTENDRPAAGWLGVHWRVQAGQR